MTMDLQYLKNLPRLLGQIRNFAKRTTGWYYTIKFDGIVQVWSEPEMIQLLGELGVGIVFDSSRPDANGRAVQTVHLDVVNDCAYLPVSLYDMIFRESQRITQDRLGRALALGRDLAKSYWTEYLLPAKTALGPSSRLHGDLLLV